jgi:hypothetical protein
VLPEEFAKVPGLQRLQLVAPEPEYEPGPQRGHALAPADGWKCPGAQFWQAVLPVELVKVPGSQGVHGIVPVGLEDPGEQLAAVPHCGPEYPALHEQEPVVGLLFRHVPFPLHTISQPVPLEHGLHEHTDVLKLQTPAPLQLRGHGPKPETRVAGRSVSSELPIAIAASTLRTVRPDDFRI